MDANWVELRVHGVSGTPPESLLGVPNVKQVAGDDYSRFFRPDPEPLGHVVEAYHWGRFTSGSWKHALTLLFLPFGMVNATQFMLPRREQEAGYDRALRVATLAVLRLLALLLTALFSFALGLILIDLVGWRWSQHTRLLQNYPDGVVLAGCVLASAVGVVLLAYLARPGFIRAPHADLSGNVDTRSRLGVHLYHATAGSRSLAALHLAAGLLVVALLGDLASTGRHPAETGGFLRTAILTVLVAVVVLVLGIGDTQEGGVAQRREVAVLSGASVLLAAAGVLWAAARVSQVSLASASAADTAELDRIVRFDEVANGLMRVGVLVLAALAVSVLLLAIRGGYLRRTSDADDTRYFRPYAWGTTSFLVAALATFIGIGFSAAAATAVSSTLKLNVDAKRIPGMTEATGQVRAGSSLMLDRVAYAWGLTIFELLGLALVVLGGRALARRTFGDAVRATFWDRYHEGEALPAGWPARVARAMYVARLKTALPAMVILIVTVGVAISLVQLVESFGCGDGTCNQVPGPLGLLSEPRVTPGSIFVITIGAWALVAAAGAIVTISRGALKDSGLRRGINVVWDVFGFWPHAVHPFGPEPYSRWAVIELCNRIRYHLDSGKAGVAVCAHSQGSVISFAAIQLLTPEERSRVSLLTCGSQLRVIYPRAFPAYFNLPAVTWMFGALGQRWVNLYRSTDPLAGPVLSWRHDAEASRHFPLPPGQDRADDEWRAGEELTRRCGRDWRLADPVPYDAEVETGPVNAIHGHHDYWLDPAWERALSELAPS